ncbi:adenylate/guanylate cyclase domain-containing protein [Marimonas sp. MJW-29]|uniref:Adenylate/guanylate cyclase domain-containing protein n=1 Tax=Sulfitobacter sediminis TaxID=3234186 RepID=A0ABV3RQQ4_9RHOB
MRAIERLAVNIASRVQSLADPGEILVSQTVREMLMGSGLTLSDRGTHALKGVDGSWTVYSLGG